MHLRTAAEPAFSRRVDGHDDSMGLDGDATQPTFKGPSIPEGQKPEEEVKLVGKPLMFKPLLGSEEKGPVEDQEESNT